MATTIEDVAALYKQKALPDRLQQLQRVLSTQHEERDIHDPAQSLFELYNHLLRYARNEDKVLLKVMSETVVEFALRDGLKKEHEQTQAILDLLVNTGSTHVAMKIIELVETESSQIIEDLVGTLASFANQGFYDETIRLKLEEWFYKNTFSGVIFPTIFYGLSLFPIVKENWWKYLPHFLRHEFPEIVEPSRESSMYLMVMFYKMPAESFRKGIANLPERYHSFAEAAWDLVTN